MRNSIIVALLGFIVGGQFVKNKKYCSQPRGSQPHGNDSFAKKLARRAGQIIKGVYEKRHGSADVGKDVSKNVSKREAPEITNAMREELCLKIGKGYWTELSSVHCDIHDGRGFNPAGVDERFPYYYHVAYGTIELVRLLELCTLDYLKRVFFNA